MQLPSETCSRSLVYSERDKGEGRRRPMALILNGRENSASLGATDMSRRDLLALAALGIVVGAPSSATAASPEGQLTWGVHVSLAPIWFDPADVSGIITPFMVLYALHDAMVKLMPGQSPAPSLAEAWSASEDGLTYDFTLRQGTLFHNGDPVMAEDVKFSFERYRGASHDLMMERVAAVEIPTRSARSLQAQKAVARLPYLLCQRHRRRLDRAQEICRNGRGGGVQKGADRRRALQI